MSFSSLKKSSGSSISNLTAALDKMNKTGGGRGPDERLWKPEVDKAGNGYAVIRFLPAKEGEDLPWVRYWDHGFKGPNGLWYIENSLTSIGQPDPVSEMNTQLWNTGREEDKAIARERKRRLHYVANIKVISDSANPSAEGNVYLYRFGKKIFDKIMDAMQPQYADESPVNPYDFWEGADFKIKVRKVDGYWNYDKSEFATPKPLSEDDEKLEAIWNSQHSLKDVIAPSEFKSYDELKQKLDRVLGMTASTATAASVASDMDDVAYPSPEPSIVAPTTASADVEEDDTMSYFQKLANDV